MIIYILLFVIIISLLKKNNNEKFDDLREIKSEDYSFKDKIINQESIYDQTNISNIDIGYDKNTIYDKLVDIFTDKEQNINQCVYDKKPDHIRELETVFRLISVPHIVFNRASRTVSKECYKKDTNNKLLPIAQSVIDILNEKLNKTCIITSITNIEKLKTEEQTQISFIAQMNYPMINKTNQPLFKNISVHIIIIKKELLQDDIFAPNRYDTSKFVIKSMKLIDINNTKGTFKPKKYDNNHLNYNDLLKQNCNNVITSDEYVNKEMIRNRKKHEHEMDFRNIIIEDDNYLNNYMIPEKICN